MCPSRSKFSKQNQTKPKIEAKELRESTVWNFTSKASPAFSD
jgi:hypothetical protein